MTSIKLTKTEISLLLILVQDQINSGEYWGRKDHFDQRISKIEQKLKGGLENG